MIFLKEKESLVNKMIKITIASSNPHKLEEINDINNNPDIVFDVITGTFNPVESGNTFEENAIIKAKAASKITGEYCLADDSGLCVDSLEGQPGIYSSRYESTPLKRIEKLLNELKGLPFDNRSAHFTCSMVLTDPSGNILHTEIGKVYGYIDDSIKGTNGFGYDPVFYLPQYDKTIAELDKSVKNKISHRAKALYPMLEWIEKNLL